jgi:hypothetical protein
VAKRPGGAVHGNRVGPRRSFLVPCAPFEVATLKLDDALVLPGTTGAGLNVHVAPTGNAPQLNETGVAKFPPS